MGTNYYLKTDCCKHCGRAAKRMHIGKSSGGWCFALHVDPDDGINGLSDWEYLWSLPGAQISDEYGCTISPEEMRDRICSRLWKDGAPKRHEVDGRHCIGNGSGTYDLITGEFS